MKEEPSRTPRKRCDAAPKRSSASEEAQVETAHGMRGSRDRGHDTETSAVPTGPHGTAARRYERHDGTRHDSSQTEAVRASVAAASHDNMHTCMRRGTFPAHRLPRRRFWLRVRSKFQRTASSHGGVTGKLFSRGRRDLSPPQRSRRTRSEVMAAPCGLPSPMPGCLLFGLRRRQSSASAAKEHDETAGKGAKRIERLPCMRTALLACR